MQNFIETWDEDLIGIDDIRKIFKNNNYDKVWTNFTIDAVLKDNSEITLFKFPANSQNKDECCKCEKRRDEVFNLLKLSLNVFTVGNEYYD